jgi:hypothetical protein
MVGDLASGQGYGASENFIAMGTKEVEHRIAVRMAAGTGDLQRKL